ncbi:MAG: hypothetical protein COU68_02855 [Candidatus Pacebacteria bacterium CG10_big_fil_rev_8_21_14_0_10_45_6]|nr:MAG: hypothetical protein COU68_02855 [Candidatus Pacebacteria bacterium CG10_big_fil_rev_8_21_14_0_10_45_6]
MQRLSYKGALSAEFEHLFLALGESAKAVFKILKLFFEIAKSLAGFLVECAIGHAVVKFHKAPGSYDFINPGEKRLEGYHEKFPPRFFN